MLQDESVSAGQLCSYCLGSQRKRRTLAESAVREASHQTVSGS